MAITYAIHARNIVDLLENSAHCIDSYIGYGRSQVLILQVINTLHQKRIWPHRTRFFVYKYCEQIVNSWMFLYIYTCTR